MRRESRPIDLTCRPATLSLPSMATFVHSSPLDEQTVSVAVITVKTPVSGPSIVSMEIITSPVDYFPPAVLYQPAVPAPDLRNGSEHHLPVIQVGRTGPRTRQKQKETEPTSTAVCQLPASVPTVNRKRVTSSSLPATTEATGSKRKADDLEELQLPPAKKPVGRPRKAKQCFQYAFTKKPFNKKKKDESSRGT